jgi:hypothetical protein
MEEASACASSSLTLVLTSTCRASASRRPRAPSAAGGAVQRWSTASTCRTSRRCRFLPKTRLHTSAKTWTRALNADPALLSALQQSLDEYARPEATRLQEENSVLKATSMRSIDRVHGGLSPAEKTQVDAQADTFPIKTHAKNLDLTNQPAGPLDVEGTGCGGTK